LLGSVRVETPCGTNTLFAARRRGDATDDALGTTLKVGIISIYQVVLLAGSRLSEPWFHWAKWPVDFLPTCTWDQKGQG
jgi:hypothetical protein